MVLISMRTIWKRETRLGNLNSLTKHTLIRLALSAMAPRVAITIEMNHGNR